MTALDYFSNGGVAAGQARCRLRLAVKRKTKTPLMKPGTWSGTHVDFLPQRFQSAPAEVQVIDTTVMLGADRATLVAQRCWSCVVRCFQRESATEMQILPMCCVPEARFALEKNVLWKRRLGGILARTYLGLSPLC